MQLSPTEHQTLRGIESELAVVRLGRASAFDDVVTAMREVLDTENVVISLQGEHPDGRYAVLRHHTAGLRDADELIGRFNRFFASAPRRYGAYDPACPEPDQRNRFHDAVELMGDAFADSPVCRNVLGPYGLGRHRQPRVLICDGPSLLAWFGSFHPRPYTRRQRALLGRFLPSVRRRLLVERRLADGAGTSAAIEACLGHLAIAAFVIDARGRILESNAAGRGLLVVRPADVRASLVDRRAKRAAALPFELTPLVEGARRTWLATLPVQNAAERERMGVTAAARRWNLTPRQLDVLSQLVAGKPTATIATALRISIRAVELHITAMFDRAGVDSRAALIASALLAR